MKKFVEVKQGLCLYEVETGYNSVGNFTYSTHEPEDASKFIIETMAWKGEEMPRALQAWSDWLRN